MGVARFRLPAGGSYEDICARFRWSIPDRFNIGVEVCDVHADGTGRPALIRDDLDGPAAVTSFDQLKLLSNRAANLLAAHGAGRGERVGILLPQRPETAIAHIAAYKAGAIALPLFTQFGPEALEHRLAHSGARVLITDLDNLPKLAAIRHALPALKHVFLVDGVADGAHDFRRELDRAGSDFTPVDTRADDPALVIYTSGTTGKPKGALHGHRVLLGHIPGVQFPQDLFPQPGDLFWTPADWAWGGGLLDVLLPSLYFGIPVLAHRARKFDPDQAFHLMAKHGVRNSFLPPTALKLMRQVARPQRHGYRLRSIGSGGEALGADILGWCRDTFDLDVNEFYGQTEANLTVGNCNAVYPSRPRSIGRAIPGHRVEVVADDGAILPPGEHGLIAVHRDPVHMLGYWNDLAATAAKYRGEWLLTGDIGTKDADGYFWYEGRDDDIISSGGYRIGPTDIEDCILRHPGVLMVAAVGSPDRVRGEVVKAFVQLRAGFAPGDVLADEIKAIVRDRLAAYQYPRDIEFVADLPMTATGKLRRNVLRELERSRKAGALPG